MLSRSLGLLALTALLACSQATTEEEEGASEDAEVIGGSKPHLCAAMRGNGENIGAHFASLSSIVEHYGVVDGMAGGSSGSITTFLYESILQHPATLRCGDKPCKRAEAAERVALALKSVHVYGATLGQSDEATAIRDLVSVAGKLKADVEAKGIPAIAQRDTAEAAKRLNEVLSNPDIRDLVNPEIFTLLADAEHLAFNVREITTAITTLGAFSVDDNRLFFRTGALNWNALAKLFGGAADFYAGYGVADAGAMRAWLDTCAHPTRGLDWEEAAAFTPAGASASCGASFSAMVVAYRAKAKTATAGQRSRLDDRVGAAGSPLRKLLSTSVLEGKGIQAWDAANRAYRSGAHPTGNVPFAISFDDVRFGYWGAQEDLDGIAARARGSDDKKTSMFSALGNATWREVLTASPAEPGLSRFVKLADGRISGGGWSDLAPSLVLDQLGCERTVYVTRRGDESGFATKIAKQLGMSEAQWSELYNLGNPKSSYSRSIAQADGVWCTDWNSFGPSKQRELAADAFAAPFEVRSGWKGIRPLSPYAKESASLGLAGCTPGVSGGAKAP